MYFLTGGKRAVGKQLMTVVLIDDIYKFEFHKYLDDDVDRGCL